MKTLTLCGLLARRYVAELGGSITLNADGSFQADTAHPDHAAIMERITSGLRWRYVWKGYNGDSVITGWADDLFEAKLRLVCFVPNVHFPAIAFPDLTPTEPGAKGFIPVAAYSKGSLRLEVMDGAALAAQDGDTESND